MVVFEQPLKSLFQASQQIATISSYDAKILLDNQLSLETRFHRGLESRP